MAKYLVVVESPAKTRTIGGYLGKDYEVKSSLGHVRDLPAKQLGVDPKDGWKAEYVISDRHQKVVADLKKAARNAEAVYLATDPDREGEAIAWHLAKVLGDKKPFRRVVFNEITRDAIRDSFTRPGELDMALVEAQWSRRFLDRIVGYQVSPLLWRKNLRGASAGRVQSVALKMLVEREREIRKFVPREYWEARLLLSVDGHEIEFKLKKYQQKAFTAGSREEMDAHEAKLRELLADASISERDDRPLSPRPGAPFITSSMQRTASSRLSMNLRRSMQLAQSLYEAGLITYMRTDSTHLSDEAVRAARGFIGKNFAASGSDNYLPEQPRRYASRTGAQESHEAIRPTSADMRAGDLPKKVDDAARRLYDLIYRRFIACQMANPRLLRTRLTVRAGDYELEAVGRVTLFDGFLKVWPESGEDDTPLPQVKEGEPVTLKDVKCEQKFTQPPHRYNEANLVRELEKNGIGRPSTYADIVSTLQKRGYTRLDKKRFFVERLGEVVCSKLQGSFPRLMDYQFTAGMEADLDRVAAGDVGWRKLLDDFYGDFERDLDLAADSEQGMTPVRRRGERPTDLKCEKCGRPMTLCLGPTGLFLGCSGYGDENNECKSTRNLVQVFPGSEAAAQAKAGNTDSVAQAALLKRDCELCGSPCLLLQVDPGCRLWVCERSPDCEWTAVELGNFGELIASEEDKSGAFGPVHLKQLACQKHPEDYYILRAGRNGLFLSASGWPKRKETRNLLVKELPLVGDALGEPYSYLLSAPKEDPDGKDMEVAFHRKVGEHFARTSGLQRGESGWMALRERKGGWKMIPPKPKAESGTAKSASKSASKSATKRTSKSAAKGASKSTGKTARGGKRRAAGKSS